MNQAGEYTLCKSGSCLISVAQARQAYSISIPPTHDNPNFPEQSSVLPVQSVGYN